MKYWLNNCGEESYGPYELEQLRTLQSEGRVAATAQVCPEGSTRWVPAASVLMTANADSPPPPNRGAPPPPVTMPGGSADRQSPTSGRISYCTNCASEVGERAMVCIKCGVPPRVARNYCYNCGSPLNPQQMMCIKCGVGVGGSSLGGGSGFGGSRTRVAAGLLALFVGGIGIHKFYHGSWGFGIIYVVFFWTFIPAIVAVVEGIMYLTMDDAKYGAMYVSTPDNPFKW